MSTAAEEERSLRVLVRGHVQGVGFRYFTRDVGRQLGLRGWVRNLRDGRTVEVHAVGPASALERFLEQLRAGPPGALVTGVEVVEESPPKEAPHRFEIWPTA